MSGPQDLRWSRSTNKLSPVKLPLRMHALVGFVLTVLVALAYAPIYRLTFLSDDWTIIRMVTLPDTATTTWPAVLADFYTPLLQSGPMYRPMYSLSFGVNYSLFGTDPLGYHLTNLALHAAVSFFVYLLALELIREERRWGMAFTAGTLFALYPIHPEAVTWIAGRVDVIVAVFYLPSVLFFLRWLRTERTLDIGLSVLFFVLALMSKEMAVALPGVLFLCALYRRRSLKAASLGVLPFAAVLGGYLLFRFYVLSGLEGMPVARRGLEPVDSVLGFVYRTGHIFLPLNLGLLPGGWRGLFDALIFLSPVAVAAIAALACYRGWLRGALPLLLFALYAVSLVPVFKALRPDPVFVHSRWSYIPAAFLAILLAYLLWTLLGHRVHLAAPVAVLVCAAFLAVLILNNGPWLRAEEITQEYLASGKRPEYPLDYKGAHVFVNEATWRSASLPPFRERP